MINYTEGDIFNDPAQALVNPVNCVGVMGKGLALAFKQRFPDNYVEYKAACKMGKVVPGRMFVVGREYPVRPWIINFPTKDHWSLPSNIEWITSGLRDLARVVDNLRIVTVAMPALGCGLGGLSWADVKTALESSTLAADRQVQVNVYQPK